MLTTTYAFLSLSMEQKRLHNLLSAAQHLLQISSLNKQHLAPEVLVLIGEQFAKLDASCRTRKVEKFVIPAVQKATNEANTLLAELESSNILGRRILVSVKEYVRLALEKKLVEMSELYSSIEHYCNNLLERLAKEEKELLPLAQRVISGDEWFAMGAQFLAMDTELKGRRPAADTSSRKTSSISLTLSDPLMSLVVGDGAYAS